MDLETFDAAAWNGRRIELVRGDITEQAVDAIVNAANRRLSGGGGVDGAIHRVGGSAIMADTRRLYPLGCPTGSAVISIAGNLRARYVIHAVGPIWGGGGFREAELLESAYQESLQLAAEHDCQSVAFPALSAGAYGYPLAEASRVAIQTAAGYCESAPEHSRLAVIRFVLFSGEVLAAFRAALSDR